ncbi:MAG: radical SAM protein [Candidatus Hodarchaeales archaeon]
MDFSQQIPNRAKDSIIILDGYTDEPSILGVPPYIAPLPRYVFGALLDLDLDNQISYFTIDQARTDPAVKKVIANSGMLIIIAGAVLPGKYIRGMPISHNELLYYSRMCSFSVLGGSVARFGFYNKGTHGEYYSPEFFSSSFKEVITGDLDASISDYFTKGEFSERQRTAEELSRWSSQGAAVVRWHPDIKIDYLIADLELFNGCVRYFTGGCSFCIEPMRGKPAFRSQEEVATEVRKLSKHGVKNFRLGGASCIFTYKSTGIGETETPKPEPKEIRVLLQKIRDSCPELRVLHTDNANPAVIANHPEESRIILEDLIKYCTGGNILSFGLESADERVYQLNNLNSTVEQCYKAIKLVNEIGRNKSPTGMPFLLPGINLLYGLSGETKNTYDKNYNFLMRILQNDLLIRRVNLRQVLNIKRERTKHKQLKRFQGHKHRILEDIERQMLKKTLPAGSVLHDLFVELYKDHVTYTRQSGTYPITVKVPEVLSRDKTFSAVVVSHNKKSVNGLVLPVKINSLSSHALKFIPGIGEKRVKRLIHCRPVNTLADFQGIFDSEIESLAWLAPFLDFNQ